MGTEIYSRVNTNQREFDKVLDSALGGSFLGVDTAECYGNGFSEKSIGQYLSHETVKKNFMVCTKFGHVESAGQLTDSFSLPSVQLQLKASLRNLKLKAIDVYYFHSGSNDQFAQNNLWDYLQEQKDKGVVKNLGLSIKHDLVKNQDNMQIDLASSYGITAIQTVLNPLHQHSLDYVVSAARKNGMTVVGRMPLSKGLIPKLSLDEIEDILEPDLKTKASISTYWEKHNLDTRSMTNAVKIGLTLKWCLEKVDAVVMAHHSLEQLEMNLKILEAIYFPTD